MRKIMMTILMLCTSIVIFAQNNNQIVGKWKTIDDESGKEKSIIEIFKKADGKYYGKINQLLIKPEHDNCVQCKGDLKNKPLIGLEFVSGLKQEKSEFTGGTITDPKNGKTYKCTITRTGDKLNVRAYVGFSLLGRTQTWLKVN